MYALGLLAALVASALFNVGIALQGIEARDTPKKLSLRVGQGGVAILLEDAVAEDAVKVDRFIGQWLLSSMNDAKSKGGSMTRPFLRLMMGR